MIRDQLHQHFKNKHPFVVYRKPNQTQVKGMFQQNDSLYTDPEFSSSGFVFAPFDESHPIVVFPLKQSLIFQEEMDFSHRSASIDTSVSNSTDGEFHQDLVAKAVKEITKSTLQKVVLSRRIDVPLSSFDLWRLFKNLHQNYPSAFVYVWYHPSVGLWIGATPETLIEIRKGYFETVSLAATKKYSGSLDVKWGEKELVEQNIVTDFILSKLRLFCSDLKAGAVETVRAGSLLHLKTVITGRLPKESDTIGLKPLLEALHPTPAVCGLPKSEAKAFIDAYESYDRKYYTGFLGELHMDRHSYLRVNLRCMELTDTHARIYVGGGITKDSDPYAEWMETVFKSEVMKRVL